MYLACAWEKIQLLTYLHDRKSVWMLSFLYLLRCLVSADFSRALAKQDHNNDETMVSLELYRPGMSLVTFFQGLEVLTSDVPSQTMQIPDFWTLLIFLVLNKYCLVFHANAFPMPFFQVLVLS